MCPPGTPEEPQGRPQEAALPAAPIPLRGHSRDRFSPGPGEWLGGLQISGVQDVLAKLGAGQSIWGQGRRKQPLCPGREALLLPPGGALCSWRPWGPDVTSAAEGAGLLCRGASPGAGQGALQASACPALK